jgi:ABC-type multidrug transport system fused ATPase/permease subunit
MDSHPHELSPIERYQQRAAHFSEEIGRLEARSRGYSNLRLAVFVIGVISVLIGPKDTPFWILLLTAVILLLLVLFIAAAIRHQLVEERLRISREMARRNEEGKARIARNWKDLPDRSAPAELVTGSLAQDLDLFGAASLFNLVCTANTWEGRKAVAQALLHGTEQQNRSDRHAAIQELAPKLEFRQLLECTTLPLRKAAVPGNALFTPLQVNSTLFRQRLLRWFCRISPFVLLILLALNLAGFLPRWPFGLLLTLNFAVSFWSGRKIKKSLKSAMSADKVIAQYLQAFRHLAAEPLSSPELVSLKTLSQEAFGKMRRLEGLISLSRLPPSIPIPGVQTLFNLILLWELQLTMAFEKWWLENGTDLSRWLEAFGTLEAACSFASLLHDNPAWSFPEFVSDDRIAAEGLGHPLIPEATRVDNDVSVGPKGQILMVTGSNMSGKTTLLRAIGINVLLAKAGGPVCAKRLALPWVDVATSMRATDSVTEGVSLFMAELGSIKAVMEMVQRITRQGDGLVLYLLDEVLLGTNIDERRVITFRLIQHLLQQSAIGAMSTHDLSLLHFTELVDHCQKIHFQETFVSDNGKLKMTFDYRIREGEAQSRNAVALMKHIGLELDERL